MSFMTHPAAATLRAALVDVGVSLVRSPGRRVSSGLHEVNELGPAIRDALIRTGAAADLVALNHPCAIADWNRPTAEVDVVVLGTGRAVELVAELKVWDIGHQLFDLAKVCCLLAAGVGSGFLISVAHRESDFDRLPGGKLFPGRQGEYCEHEFAELVATYRDEWRNHVGQSRPEPTSIPTTVRTTAVAVRGTIDAYPGHSVRAAQVEVIDPAPIRLADGWPEPMSQRR
jgi:hypothetical protein